MTVMCKGKKRTNEFSGFDSLGMSEELVNYTGKKIQDINYQFEKIVPSSCNEIIANKCKKSYFYFLQTFWDVIVNDPPHWNWHIPYLCGQMQIIIERVHKRLPRLYDLVINLPPGTTKSLICTVFLVPWIWTKYPYFRIIKVSYNDHLTLEHADYIRDIVRSEKYQEYFPHVALKFDKSGKSNFRVNFKDEETGFWRLGGGVLSTSVNAKATGFHGHLKITDDPIDPQKAVSDAELKKTNQWISQVLSSRVVDKRIVPEITIMQRVHKKDPSGIAIEKAKKGKKIKHICLPGDVLSKDNRERVKPQILLSQYDRQGGYLDPVRLDETALLELKLNLGQYGYKSQIDQNPVTPGSGMFDVSQIKIIDPGAFNFQANVVRVIRYWDKACLCKDTMIFTNKGYIPIQDVKVNDWVLTRQGFNRVKKSWLTKYTNEIVSVVFSNGAILSGTPDHRIATTKGWVELQNLTNKDIIITGGKGSAPCTFSDSTSPRNFINVGGLLSRRTKWHKQEIQNWKKGSLKVKDTLVKWVVGILNQTLGIKKKSVMNTQCTTGTYGNIFTNEVYPMATIFTTKMKTGIITNYQIWNVSHQKNIVKYTWQERLLIKCPCLIQNIARKHKKLLEKQQERSNILSVPNVGKNLVQGLLKRFNIVLNVKKKELQDLQRNEENNYGNQFQKNKDHQHHNIQKKENVKNVVQNLWQKIPKQFIAKNAAKKEEIKSGENICVKNEKLNGIPVYDLEIENCHEFIANGIVAHNSTSEDGAYTCGTKMAQLRGNLFLVMDVVRGQWGTHKRELTMQETVQIDGPDVAQYLEQEPGSGGKDSALISKEGLAEFGNKVILDRPSGDKIYRADPFSIAINLGYVAILKAKWNDAWIEELDEFPNSDYKDQVDSASGAYKELKTGKIAGTW